MLQSGALLHCIVVYFWIALDNTLIESIKESTSILSNEKEALKEFEYLLAPLQIAFVI